jgi:LysR family carnitine catabolism transcriptional activator
MERDWYPVLSRLNFHQLWSFLLVAEEESFRAAAQRMHLSQSAVSVQVQQLESLLGVSLFHRTTRKVMLTSEGLMLVRVARRVMQELHAVTQDFREQAQLQSGLVRVAALPSFAHTLVVDLMSRYVQMHPGVEVRLSDLDSAAALRALASGEADLALLGRTSHVEPFEFIHLFDDELVVLASEGHDALQGRATVSVLELASERLLLTPPGAQVRALVDAMFRQFDCKPQILQECYRPQTLLALVEKGFGVTVLPRSAVTGLGLSRVKVVELQTRHVRQVGVVTRSHQSLSPAAQSFCEFLCAHSMEPLGPC